MQKLYLLGGENIHRRSAKHVNEKAFADAGGQPNVLVFPWARAYFDNKYGKRKLLFDYFRTLGAENIEFAEYDHLEDIAQKLSNSNLVYLTGGQPTVLIERMKKMGLDRQLRSYSGVIVGRSAGALALCRKCLTTARCNSKLKVVDGLGFVDITMKAHYSQSKEETLRQFSLKEPFFAVPPRSALVYEEGMLHAIGRVYVFRNGEYRIFRKTQL